MKRATGFTLVQLLVVVFSLAMLLFLVVTLWLNWYYPARCKGQCAGNMNNVFKAVTLYQQCQDQSFPMLPGNNWDVTRDGTNYRPEGTPGAKPPYDSRWNDSQDWNSPRSVSSLMFMLVRDGQGTKVFTCPGDRDVTPDPEPQSRVTVNGATSMQYNWDFSSGQDGGGRIGSKRNVSYSWQCPIDRGSGSVDDSGIISPDPGLVILSDRAPGKFGDMKYMSGWNASADTDELRRPYNSQNHSRGKCMNVLYAGGNVANVKTPNCGLILEGSGGRGDCIFTAKDNSRDKIESLRDEGAEFGGVQDNRQHKGKNDSYLAGGRDSE